jgi:hypothetical protein
MEEQIGKHGIQVQFEDPADPKRTYMKALLPETIVKRGTLPSSILSRIVDF